MENSRLKFRAWVKEKSVMVPVSAISFEMRSILIGKDEPILIKLFKFSEIRLMQHTGCKDKSGKPIYERDIVIAPNNKTYIVKYDDLYARWLLVHNDEYGDEVYDFYKYSDTICSISELEVIGNFFENPELIKGKSNG